MELDKVITLIRAVSESRLTGFVLEEGNMKLCLEKREGQLISSGDLKESNVQEISIPVQSAAIQAEAPAAAEAPDIEPERKGIPVVSPLVGTFYNAPSPEEEPFVKLGDRVKKGQVLGIIEAMKLMNEIEAEQDGVVEAILVENEQMVEYGQELFCIL